jgi:hypothetical protein
MSLTLAMHTNGEVDEEDQGADSETSDIPAIKVVSVVDRIPNLRCK